MDIINLKKLLAKVSFVNVRNWVNLLNQPPILNQQITKKYANVMSLIGSGDLTLATPSTPISTSTAIGDASLNGFVPVEGIEFENVQKIDFSGYDIIVKQDGLYQIDGFATFKHSQNTSVVGFVYTLERSGFWLFSQRPIRADLPNIGRPRSIGGSGQLRALAGDKLRMWIATDKTGDITLDTLSITCKWISL